MADQITLRRRPGLELLEGRMLLSTIPTLSPRAAEVSALRQVQATSRHGQAQAVNPTRWSWLTDTYWYVPKQNLPATVYDQSSGALIPVLDQTVYHIAGYRNGYFWGTTVTQLGQGTPTSSALVGSVTPQGRVLLSFTSSAGVIQGYGTMNRQRGRWTMENQMFSVTSTGVQVGHWAYMVQTRPGTKSWTSLPLAGVSVPTFLGNYSGPVPSPVLGT